MKPSPPSVKRPPAAVAVSAAPEEQAFTEVIAMIEASRGRALAAVNTELIELYWKVGEYISGKLKAAEWGEGVVDKLAAHLARTLPGVREHGESRESTGTISRNQVAQSRRGAEPE